jgi:cold shock CspA family protein
MGAGDKKGGRGVVVRAKAKPAPQAKKQQRVDDRVNIGFKVDETKRHTGNVVFFDKRRGFGFVKPVTSGVVPDDKLMVHWSAISSTDTWPYLYKGLDVEFSIAKKEVSKGTMAILRADRVTQLGGAPLACDAGEEKEWLQSAGKRYQGDVKFYNADSGFGWATLAAAVGDVSEVKLIREEIAGGEAKPLGKGLKIEFGVYKKARGTLTAHDVTLPGGAPVTRDIGEGRQTFGTTEYTGEVQWYHARNGIGFLVPTDFDALPKQVQAKSTEAAQKHANKTQKESFEGLTFRRRDLSDPSGPLLSSGVRVRYTAYIDNYGAGATGITRL